MVRIIFRRGLDTIDSITGESWAIRGLSNRIFVIDEANDKEGKETYGAALIALLDMLSLIESLKELLVR